MNSSNYSVSIIGTGAVGSALKDFFTKNQYEVRSTWNSKGGEIQYEGTAKKKRIHFTIPQNDDQIGNLIFITTPDDLISGIAVSLSEQKIPWHNKTVVHCSGNFTSDELNAVFNKGASIASMHPIQTFKKKDGFERFKGITISLEGEPKARDQLKPLIERMGANCLLLDKKQKRYLHISAVMASNYLVALMYSAENLLKDVQVDEGFTAIEPLIKQTMENIFDKGPAHSLTGPISRGDIESVETHLNELKGREQEVLYKILGLEALKITEQSGRISNQATKEIREKLSKPESLL